MAVLHFTSRATKGMCDASAVEQGSPTEPQDEGVDVDVDVDGDDEEEDDEQDDEQGGEDDDRREDMSREESEEETPQGPDRGRHASIRSGKKIRIFGDSRLVFQQVDGKWACAPSYGRTAQQHRSGLSGWRTRANARSRLCPPRPHCTDAAPGGCPRA